MSKFIQSVAIYLRKSRLDEDNLERDVLETHRKSLVEYCKKNGWQYVIYEEVGSGDSLVGRPQMLKLLNDIEQDEIFIDAVLVMDYDRLSRGDGEDQSKIKKTLARSDVFVVTKDDGRIYDLNNDSDDMVTDMYAMMARFEYKMIKKRLKRGKQEGAKKGLWINGVPPIGYKLDRETRKLIIDEEKYPLYRKIIDMGLEGYSLNEIAWTLNKEGYRSKRGLLWQPKVIKDILVDETHLGKIIYQKHKGDGHADRPNTYKLERRPKSEWIIVENCHKPLKTQQEHDRIIELINSRKSIPVRARQRMFALSGLVRCGKCGRTMGMRKRGDTVSINCKKYDRLGNLCDNRSGNAQIVLDHIYAELKNYRENIIGRIQNNESSEADVIQKEIEKLIKEINKKHGALERIDEAYEEGIYDVKTYRERRKKVNDDIEKLDGDLEIQQRKLKSAESMTDADRIRIIDEFFEKFSDDLLGEEQNRMLMLILKDVKWTRVANDVNIEISFL